MENIVYGPVPSRRLGKSLGVNNIPPKICTYNCKYCQVGKTFKMQTDRQEFYFPEEIASQVKKKLLNLSSADFPDYISIIPDGEPTLDINLGELIRRLGAFGLPVAVFTNSSLLSRKDVRDDLAKADYVSIKVDSAKDFSWRKINNPHKNLSLDQILQGIISFTRQYSGELATETMLIKYLNDSFQELEKVAEFLQQIQPDIAYVAIPTRPPAFEGAAAADETSVALAYEVFLRHNLKTELLTGYEGNAFASSGDFRNDMLSITAVHPMRREAVMELMAKSSATEENLDMLIDTGLLKKIQFNNEEYYLRKFRNI
jgi:wyosine [tRNA(Phe)-imidazoG37] synthetase (radical SAM superfamily)